jgi:hypothetical protein
MPTQLKDWNEWISSNIPKIFVICSKDNRQDLFELLNIHYPNRFFEDITFTQSWICIFEVPAIVQELTDLLWEDLPYSVNEKLDVGDLLYHAKKK